MGACSRSSSWGVSWASGPRGANATKLVLTEVGGVGCNRSGLHAQALRVSGHVAPVTETLVLNKLAAKQAVRIVGSGTGRANRAWRVRSVDEHGLHERIHASTEGGDLELDLVPFEVAWVSEVRASGSVS